MTENLKQEHDLLIPSHQTTSAHQSPAPPPHLQAIPYIFNHSLIPHLTANGFGETRQTPSGYSIGASLSMAPTAPTKNVKAPRTRVKGLGKRTKRQSGLGIGDFALEEISSDKSLVCPGDSSGVYAPIDQYLSYSAVQNQGTAVNGQTAMAAIPGDVPGLGGEYGAAYPRKTESQEAYATYTTQFGKKNCLE